MPLRSILTLAREGWPEPEVHLALSLGRRRSVGSRQEISIRGAQNFHFTVLVSGIACRYNTFGEGEQAIVGFILPGDFTLPFVSVPMRADFGVMSLTPSEIVEIPSAALWARAQSNLGLSRALARSAMVDGAIARAWMANINHQPADKRLANLLCELRHRLARVGLANQYGFPLPIIQQSLADALGLSVVHINRVLQSLKKLGLVRSDNHEIVFPDLGALEQFAEFNSDYLASGRDEDGADRRPLQEGAANASADLFSHRSQHIATNGHLTG